MIFVTVGSWAFDELVKAVDEYALNSSEEIIIQIANSTYHPKNCSSFKTAPSLDEYIQRADLIIAHGGTGTTLEVLSLNKPLISVANPHVKDNHQAEFLEKLEKLGCLHYLRDLHDLAAAVAVLHDEDFTRVNLSSLWGGLSADISQLAPSSSSTLQQWLSSVLLKNNFFRIPASLISQKVR